MLTKEVIRKINEFVYQKPRSIQEIANLLKVNWRTADRWVRKIESEEGTISTRVFREGTPGALKIVFWNPMEKFHASEVQERLLKIIEVGRFKQDFSPSEIFQFVDKRKKKLKVMTEKEYYSDSNFKDFINRLKRAKRQNLFFSGNLTFINYSYEGITALKVIEKLAERKVASKALTRVEWAGIDNIRKALAINKRVGWDAIEIRHCYQPLRATLTDNKMAVLRETLNPENYQKGELKEKLYILYYIYDKDWIEWLQRIFWHLFRSSIDAKKRMEELKLIM
jgi:hypothetical protein